MNASEVPLHADTSHDGYSIAAVERETGLAKDTLRVWERRYGFPSPMRNASGDRRYDAEQLEQLTLIARLLDAGLRPGKIVGMHTKALESLLAEKAAPSPPDLPRKNSSLTTTHLALNDMLDAVAAHEPQRLRHALSHAQLRLGLGNFITELVAPLTTAVGDAWAHGRFQVFEEHLYTEVMTGILRHALATLPPQPVIAGPKVLLTTLPQELHGLGLLMVEVLLVLEGCTCVSLGTQTPVRDVVRAAQAHEADAVALSFSNVHKASEIQGSLREVRDQLPPATALWVGGACAALYTAPISGVRAVRDLAGISGLVAQWHQGR